MARRTGIGARIYDLRWDREPRMTQRELAERAGISVELIAKLEQGVKQSARLNSLTRIARALDVDLAQLLSAPPRIDAEDGDEAGVLALRQAVVASRPGVEPGDAADLAAAGADAWSDYWANRFEQLGTSLPGLIRSARAAVADRPDPRVWSALADAYGAGASMLVHLGHVDLAYLMMERARDAAAAAGDELQHARLVGWMSWLLLHQTGGLVEARYLATTQAEAIEPSMRAGTPEQLMTWGKLLVAAAVAAARMDDANEADEAINLAEVAAVRLQGRPEPPPRVASESPYGVPLVVMQAVDIAVVTNRPARALKLATRMPPDFGGMPLASRARHLADRANALIQLGRNADAEATLLQLERDAPRWMHFQPYPKTLVRELWEQERRRSAPLRRLAHRLSVPLD